MNSKRRTGFTILELLVVIAIIGILAAAVVVNVTPYPDKCRMTRVQADIGGIKSAANMFRIDHGRVPQTLEELADPPVAQGSGRDPGAPYLEQVPLDPWTHEPYIYEITADGRLLVVSYGRDMQPGGEGPDADITRQLR